MIVRAVLARFRWLAGLLACVIFSPIAVPARNMNLGWNPSSSPSVIGYRVYYGTASGQYTYELDAGSNTFTTITGLAGGTTYYFAVLDYDSATNISPLSPEMSYRVPGEQPFFAITSQPVGQLVLPGTTVSFSVGAVGPGPLLYQWFANEVLLLGATNATLTITNVGAANAGTYNVVVVSSAGALISTLANLGVTITGPPVITSQPQSQIAAAGSSITFHAGVYGTPPFSFQWYQNRMPISQATGRTLTLPSVTAANQGRYYLQVQNASGAVTTIPALLTVTNIFGTVAGVYNGLFCISNSGAQPRVRVPTSGLLGNCVVGGTGAYSATLSIGSLSYPLAGNFSALGYDSEVVSRAASGLSNLVVTLNADMTGASQIITGMVSNTDPSWSWSASLTALLATNAIASPGQAGYLIIPPLDSGVVNPPQGYATFTVLPAGVVVVMGELYDGTEFSQSVPLSGNGSFPLYASLYGGLGLMEGWVSLGDGTPDGSVTWIRPSGAESPIPEPDAFTNVINIY